MIQAMAGRWPNGARCAVVLSFDVDAETLWLIADPANAQKPGVLSMGHYGPTVGVPLLMDLLARHGLRASFFVPGWTAEHYPDMMRDIVAAGHEVGHHGWIHETPSSLTADEERAVMERGLRAIEQTAGVRPIGYRSPSWEFSTNTLGLLAEYGFRYSSNLMDTFLPYRHPETEVMELPVQWILDDAPFFLFRPSGATRPIQPAATALQAWQEEFTGIYTYGGLCMVTMHPQLSGRPGRVQMLERFIQYARAMPEPVWFDSAAEVAVDWGVHCTE
jgi:peptidoglycan/xylan/chitin deacetylase (PgdA/CDA1 family)